MSAPYSSITFSFEVTAVTLMVRILSKLRQVGPGLLASPILPSSIRIQIVEKYGVAA